MRFGTPGTKSPEIWYPMEYYIPERDLPIRGYGTPQRNGTLHIINALAKSTRTRESTCGFSVRWLSYIYIYEATTMAGSSCEDISISGGHDPRNCTWSDIRRCLYTVSIQFTLLSAKIMYMYTTKEKERFFKVCYFSKKIRNVCYMYSYI